MDVWPAGGISPRKHLHICIDMHMNAVEKRSVLSFCRDQRRTPRRTENEEEGKQMEQTCIFGRSAGRRGDELLSEGSKQERPRRGNYRCSTWLAAVKSNDLPSRDLRASPSQPGAYLPIVFCSVRFCPGVRPETQGRSLCVGAPPARTSCSAAIDVSRVSQR